MPVRGVALRRNRLGLSLDGNRIGRTGFDAGAAGRAVVADHSHAVTEAQSAARTSVNAGTAADTAASVQHKLWLS